jgi:hypothetical protein
VAARRARDFERKGPSGVIDQWTRYSSFANGRRIEIHDGVRRISGITRGLSPLGALRIEPLPGSSGRSGVTEKGGGYVEVYSGDVVAWE